MRRRVVGSAIAVLAVGAAVVGGIAVASVSAPSTKTVLDMHGHAVTVDSAQVPTHEQLKAAHATDASAGRFEAASVGLNVPLGALDAVDGSITPPGFASAYWVRNMGVSVADGDKGTVFVVMHSVRGGGVGPGNYLIDVQHQKAKVAVGSTIRVDDATYAVTGAEAVPKTNLAADQSVWANTPDRLVVITCLQLPSGGPSHDNMVITATRVAS